MLEPAISLQSVFTLCNFLSPPTQYLADLRPPIILILALKQLPTKETCGFHRILLVNKTPHVKQPLTRFRRSVVIFFKVL